MKHRLLTLRALRNVSQSSNWACAGTTLHCAEMAEPSPLTWVSLPNTENHWYTVIFQGLFASEDFLLFLSLLSWWLMNLITPGLWAAAATWLLQLLGSSLSHAHRIQGRVCVRTINLGWWPFGGLRSFNYAWSLIVRQNIGEKNIFNQEWVSNALIWQ